MAEIIEITERRRSYTTFTRGGTRYTTHITKAPTPWEDIEIDVYEFEIEPPDPCYAVNGDPKGRP